MNKPETIKLPDYFVLYLLKEKLENIRSKEALSFDNEKGKFILTQLNCEKQKNKKYKLEWPHNVIETIQKIVDIKETILCGEELKLKEVNNEK